MSKSLRLLAVALVALTAAVLTACDDDEPYYTSPLVGDWVMIADDQGPVDDGLQPVFNFYSDGTGIYTDYDQWGYEYTYDIFWQPSGTMLYVMFDDGQQWSYRWSVTGSLLYLYDIDTGSQLTFQLY